MAFALRRFQRHVALCRLQWQRAAGRRFHAGLVSGHAAGNGDLFNSGQDASHQSTAHISALYSGGNAGGRNHHGDQGHRDDVALKISVNIENAHTWKHDFGMSISVWNELFRDTFFVFNNTTIIYLRICATYCTLSIIKDCIYSSN